MSTGSPASVAHWICSYYYLFDDYVIITIMRMVMRTLVGWQSHWWPGRETLGRGRLGRPPAGHRHHHDHFDDHFDDDFDDEDNDNDFDDDDDDEDDD